MKTPSIESVKIFFGYVLIAYIAFAPIYLAIWLLHALLPELELFSTLYSVARLWLYPLYLLYIPAGVLSLIVPIGLLFSLPVVILGITIYYSIRLWNSLTGK